MPSTAVADIIEDLQKYYGKKLNGSQSEFYQSQLTPLDESDLCRAIITMKGKEPVNFIPAVATIKRYFYEAREQTLNREKEHAPIYDDIKRNANRTEHGKEAIKLMESLFDGLVSRKQYVAGMYAMDVKYPGWKWREYADLLAAFWNSEEKRHGEGRKYLERIWRLQDAGGEPGYNNPMWYIEKMDIKAQEDQRDVLKEQARKLGVE